MRKYNSLRFIAISYQVIAYIMLILGGIIAIVSYPVWSLSAYSILMVLGFAIFILSAFICLLALAQSIMLMINLADDVSVNANNTFVIAQHLEKSLKSQQAIIELLSKERGNSSSPKIDPNEL